MTDTCQIPRDPLVIVAIEKAFEGLFWVLFDALPKLFKLMLISSVVTVMLMIIHAAVAPGSFSWDPTIYWAVAIVLVAIISVLYRHYPDVSDRIGALGFFGLVTLAVTLMVGFFATVGLMWIGAIVFGAATLWWTVQLFINWRELDRDDVVFWAKGEGLLLITTAWFGFDYVMTVIYVPVWIVGCYIGMTMAAVIAAMTLMTIDYHHLKRAG